METLKDVRKQVDEIESASRKLDMKDARLLRKNREAFRGTAGEYSRSSSRSTGGGGQGGGGGREVCNWLALDAGVVIRLCVL